MSDRELAESEDYETVSVSFCEQEEREKGMEGRTRC